MCKILNIYSTEFNLSLMIEKKCKDTLRQQVHHYENSLLD